MSVTWDVSDLVDLAADLAGAGARVDAGATVATHTAAETVATVSRGLCPVLTGTLRSSISVDGEGLSAEIGPTVNYGVYVEGGTSVMAPQPFMGPALDTVTPAYMEALATVGVDAVLG